MSKRQNTIVFVAKPFNGPAVRQRANNVKKLIDDINQDLVALRQGTECTAAQACYASDACQEMQELVAKLAVLGTEKDTVSGVLSQQVAALESWQQSQSTESTTTLRSRADAILRARIPHFFEWARVDCPETAPLVVAEILSRLPNMDPGSRPSQLDTNQYVASRFIPMPGCRPRLPATPGGDRIRSTKQREAEALDRNRELEAELKKRDDRIPALEMELEQEKGESTRLRAAVADADESPDDTEELGQQVTRLQIIVRLHHGSKFSRCDQRRPGRFVDADQLMN